MDHHFGTREDLLNFLSLLGIESAEARFTTVNYQQVLSLMTQHVMNSGGLDAGPGSVVRTLLEAVAKGIVNK